MSFFSRSTLTFVSLFCLLNIFLFSTSIRAELDQATKDRIQKMADEAFAELDGDEFWDDEEEDSPRKNIVFTEDSYDPLLSKCIQTITTSEQTVTKITATLEGSVCEPKEKYKSGDTSVSCFCILPDGKTGKATKLIDPPININSADFATKACYAQARQELAKLVGKRSSYKVISFEVSCDYDGIPEKRSDQVKIEMVDFYGLDYMKRKMCHACFSQMTRVGNMSKIAKQMDNKDFDNKAREINAKRKQVGEAK